MKVAIVGFGKSGKASKALLEGRNIKNIDIFDDKDSAYPNISELDLSYDEIVLSPGVDFNRFEAIKEYIKRGKVRSEIELAYGEMKSGAKVIAITGTNGKSTTTHLTSQILNNAGVKAIACGNIGFPYAEAVKDKSIDAFVIELSSFQIDILYNFVADAACIINVTQDHLDRYKTMENYYKSKLRLMHFTSKDGIFLTGKDTQLINASILQKFQARFIDETFKGFPKLKDNILDFTKFQVDISSFSLFGRHNLVNLSFALLLADKVADFKGDVTELLKGLTAMPHRVEEVARFNDIVWINDSKATNVDSVQVALTSIEKPSTLLIGGRDKKSDYTPLASLINKNISTICYFGEAGGLIKSQISDLLEGVVEESYDSLHSATKEIASRFKGSKERQTIILSPACTSFDEFKSYEDRGEKFKEYIYKYMG